MCIRDRVYAGRNGIIGALTEDLIDTTKDTAKSIAALRYTCLLYTSDAADERSSVDLGGRRLIKQKKSNVNTLVDTY